MNVRNNALFIPFKTSLYFSYKGDSSLKSPIHGPSARKDQIILDTTRLLCQYKRRRCPIIEVLTSTFGHVSFSHRRSCHGGAVKPAALPDPWPNPCPPAPGLAPPLPSAELGLIHFRRRPPVENPGHVRVNHGRQIESHQLREGQRSSPTWARVIAKRPSGSLNSGTSQSTWLGSRPGRADHGGARTGLLDTAAVVGRIDPASSSTRSATGWTCRTRRPAGGIRRPMDPTTSGSLQDIGEFRAKPFLLNGLRAVSGMT